MRAIRQSVPGNSRTVSVTADASWAVVCDFDGTISRVDGTDALLQRHALPGWLDLENRWVAGEITGLECMQGQIALLAASDAVLRQFALELPIDESFRTFAAACAARQFPLVVASDGLDLLIKATLDRLGMTAIPVWSGRLESIGGDRYRLDAPAAELGCLAGGVTCKCGVASRLATNPDGRRRKLLLVGDGLSDFCLATHAADMVIARGKLLAYCREQAIPCLPFNTFSEAAGLLDQLTPAEQLPAIIGGQSLQGNREPWLQI